LSDDLGYLTVSFAVMLWVSVPEVPVNVTVDMPLEAPFGTAKSTVTLAMTADDVSVTEDGITVQIEFGGPPLQVRLIVPQNRVVVSR
jgi:hypothetical protein